MAGDLHQSLDSPQAEDGGRGQDQGEALPVGRQQGGLPGQGGLEQEQDQGEREREKKKIKKRRGRRGEKRITNLTP